MSPRPLPDLRAFAGAFLALLGACSAPREATVERWGELRAVLREGRTEGRVELARAERPGAVGIGALAGLAGEVVVLDGRATVSRARAARHAARAPRRPAPGERATFLALQTPARWSESRLGAIGDLAELETAVAERLAALGSTRARRAPSSSPAGARARLPRAERAPAPSPRRRRRPSATPSARALADAQVLLVGFFAEGQEGRLTHHGQRSHVHVLHGLAGHVDEVALDAARCCAWRSTDVDAPAELEACLAVVGPARAATCAALRALRSLAGRASAPSSARELEDAYYDTADGRLAAADMAVRLRSERAGGATRRLVTWKGPCEAQGATGVARAELEGPADAAHLARVAEAAGLALAASDAPEDALAAAGLAVVQARRTERWAAPLVGADGATRAELALDLVEYRLGARVVRHAELELEARGATTLDELEHLAAALAAAHPGRLRAWPWSKTALGRALERLQEAGELDDRVAGDELSDAGYDAVEAALRG
ncbi:MAG: CYTH domain-containing protein [Planctomycetes bacterium]|nr:CYTH domain-containing protein [Planctomycetota bacterium]